MRLLGFGAWFIWRACWSSGVFPGNFYWTVWIGIWSWWGNLWRWGAEESFQERRPHGYPWELFFIWNFSISPLICIHVLATSFCQGSTEEGDCEETFGSSFRQPRLPRRIPFVPVLIGPAPCWGGNLMRVMLWLLCGDFQYDSSFDPQCTLFSCSGLVYCISCFYEQKCHQAPARV